MVRPWCRIPQPRVGGQVSLGRDTTIVTQVNFVVLIYPNQYSSEQGAASALRFEKRIAPSYRLEKMIALSEGMAS